MNKLFIGMAVSMITKLAVAGGISKPPVTILNCVNPATQGQVAISLSDQHVFLKPDVDIILTYQSLAIEYGAHRFSLVTRSGLNEVGNRVFVFQKGERLLIDGVDIHSTPGGSLHLGALGVFQCVRE